MQEQHWWQLPGPARFVAAAAHDLAQGTSVVLALPEPRPNGLPGALRALAPRAYWEALRPDPTLPPLEQVGQHWQRHTHGPAPATVAALVQHPDFVPGPWLLVLAPAVAAADWADFARAYGRASTARPAAQRIPLCVVLTGTLPPRPDTGLNVYHYDDQTSDLDMLLFVANASRAYYPDWKAARRALYAHTALNLFPADPAAALRLLELDLPTLLAPNFLLAELARTYGWPPTPLPPPAEHWQRGWLLTVDGRPAPHHSAPGTGPDSEPTRLHRALWQAQAQVLLPLIERRRHQLLRLPFLRNHLKHKVPYEYFLGEAQKPFTVAQVGDFELAQILYLFPENRNNQHSANELPSAKRETEFLLICRNTLSHLRCLSATEVASLLALDEGSGPT